MTTDIRAALDAAEQHAAAEVWADHPLAIILEALIKQTRAALAAEPVGEGVSSTIRAALEKLVELDNSSPMQDGKWAIKHENAIADAIAALAAEPVGEGASPTIRTALERLLAVCDTDESNLLDIDPDQLLCAISDARAALAAEPVGEGPSERIVSIAKAVQECAFAHGPDARLIGNVCAEDVADLCAAILAFWGRPTFRQQYPNGATVRDRLGWLVRGVVACEPMTGEVISVVAVNGRMLCRHAFHPAPLTIEPLAEALAARPAAAAATPPAPREREVSEWINSLPLWHGATRDELTGIVLRAFARWGRPPAPATPETPAEALAARPLLEQMARLQHSHHSNPWSQMLTLSSRAAAWLRENPPGKPVAIEPPTCPTPGACACVEPAPPALEPGEVGEVGELVKWLGVVSEQFRLAKLSDEANQTDRAATLLSQLSAPAPAVVPVAVAERLPGEGDCDAEGDCWLLTTEDGYPQWRLHSIEGNQPGGRMIWIPVDKAPGVMEDSFYASHWLPAHAIPLPQVGEGAPLDRGSESSLSEFSDGGMPLG